MMMCYAGIDLHATNSVLVVIDNADRVLYQKRLRNDLPLILTTLEPYRLALNGIVVESTYRVHEPMPQHSRNTVVSSTPTISMMRSGSRTCFASGCFPPGTFLRKRHGPSVICFANGVNSSVTKRWSFSVCQVC